MKFINVRGCNGSGKTTLLRMLARDPLCRVETVRVTHEIKDPKTKEKVRTYHPPIPVTYAPGGVAMLGDYTPGATGTTAGCDRIKTQEAAKSALELIAQDADVRVVLFEGVVVSTIFGPWKEWAEANGGMLWAFLDTPLEVCLERIQTRNGGKPIKEELVASKWRTIAGVRKKALKAGLPVADIRWEAALLDGKALVRKVAEDQLVYEAGEPV